MIDKFEIIKKHLEEKKDIHLGNIFYSNEFCLRIDKYNEIIVLQWWTKFFEKRLKELLDLLTDMGFKHIIERNDTFKRKKRGLKLRKRVLRGNKHRTKVQINDWTFHVDCLQGQRTGLYLDQLDNYRRITSLVQTEDYETVLDLFSYTGGFGIHCSKYVDKVFFVDRSEYAVREGENNLKENKILNGFFEKADALEFMYDTNLKPDLVIVDPPYKIDGVYLFRIFKLIERKFENPTVIFINRVNLRIKPFKFNLLEW